MRDTFPFPYDEEQGKAFIASCLDKRNWRYAASGVFDPYDLKETDDRVLIPTTYVVSLHDEVVGGIGLRYSKDTSRLTAEVGYW